MDYNNPQPHMEEEQPDAADDEEYDEIAEEVREQEEYAVDEDDVEALDNAGSTEDTVEE